MKKFSILLFLAIVAGIILKSQNLGNGLLWNSDINNGGQWFFLFMAVTAGALIDSVNPCAFSVLLLTIAFLFSMGKSRFNILKIGGAYILGIFSVYILIGLGILRTLYFFNASHCVSKLAAWLLIILGTINIINNFFPNFPIKLKIPSFTHSKIACLMSKVSFFSAFILGGLVGLCEFPCTGGPYLMILGLLHDKADFYKGLGYLLYYNLIFILPLIIILMLSGNKILFAKIDEWKKQKTLKMRFLSGIGMIILGIIILAL